MRHKCLVEVEEEEGVDEEAGVEEPNRERSFTWFEVRGKENRRRDSSVTLERQEQAQWYLSILLFIAKVNSRKNKRGKGESVGGRG